MSNAVAHIPQQSTGFALQPQNMNEAMQMATMLANSQMIPQNYKGKPEDTLVAMMMGSELKLNPIQSLQNIAVINGRPAIWGDAMIALVQNHPKFGGIKEEFDEPTMTAICQVWRKGGEVHTVTFSQADATQAQLWGKKGPWTQYPKRMLKLRARGFALRDQFADALSGLISAEEAEDMPNESVRGTQQVSVNQVEQPDNSEAIAEIKANLQNINTVEDLSGYFEMIDSSLVAQVKPLFTARHKEIQNA